MKTNFLTLKILIPFSRMFFHSLDFSCESSKKTSCTVQLLCQFQLTKRCQLESELEEPGPEPSDFNLENWKPAQVPALI
jgi:hypothetical protein